MKKIIKLGIIILILTLFCSMLCGFAIGNKKLQAAIENQTEHFGGGSGTESDPYQISNAKQLRLLSDMVNLEYNKNYRNAYCKAYYKLTADIDLGGKKSPWSPIGTYYGESGNVFFGHFDGDGHTISGIYIKSKDFLINDKCMNYGLFGEISDGSVKNLTIKASYINVESKEENWVGAIAGEIRDTLIDNCHVLSDVELIASCEAGGLVGKTYGDETGRISNCTNAASVLGTGNASSAGGIAAQCSTDIENCKNIGSIAADKSAGGIAADIHECIVSDSNNSGNIKAEYAGGIGASFSTSSFVNTGVNQENFIKNCVNSGYIEGDFAGGLVSKMDCGGKYGGAIISCENRGSVTAGSDNAYGIAGIVSHCMITGEAALRVEDCKNSGKLIAKTVDEYSGTFGGIMGYITSTAGSVEIIACENFVDITSNGTCGGILGEYTPGPAGDDAKQTEIKISGCKNNGDLYGGSLGVGGIMGTLSSFERSNVRLIVSDCINSGNLETNSICSRLGGILAVIEPAGAGCDIENCVNEGTLTPGKLPKGEKIFGTISTAEGGIIGLVGINGVDPALADEVTLGSNATPIGISNCKNHGKIVTHDDAQVYYTDDMVGLSYVDVEIK